MPSDSRVGCPPSPEPRFPPSLTYPPHTCPSLLLLLLLLLRFLPNFKKKNVKRKKPLQAQKEQKARLQAPGGGGEGAAAAAGAAGGPKPKKKEYTPFPPSQPLSKIDKQIESGRCWVCSGWGGREH